MKLAIMQPYFLPYIGYFQLIAAADAFVIYDRIKYTKKGWINRNRFLQGDSDAVFSIPLSKDSDQLDVVERRIAPDYRPEKPLNQLHAAYQGAPFFEQTWNLLERVFRHGEDNLFAFIHHSVREVCRHLDIGTDIRVSSGVPIDRALKGQDKVIAICQALEAKTYINPIGGTELYCAEDFRSSGLDLLFLRPRPVEYRQFGGPFVRWLSIVDVLMFNPPDRVRSVMLPEFDLLQPSESTTGSNPGAMQEQTR